MFNDDREHQLDRHIGARMRTRREELGLSQDDVALVVGVTAERMEEFEQGRSRPSEDEYAAIADCLGVPIRYFFEGFGGHGG